ncbi:hypothetical protein [Pantoea sp. BAV 3049]|uniref:hypothetical protein n=1 Tax=Pantoea sp. BAV 3049 TaxID=2654188 RepID=UPI00131D6040|nr:hypothetical protein [Pantoea sp. BAV 3049]
MEKKPGFKLGRFFIFLIAAFVIFVFFSPDGKKNITSPSEASAASAEKKSETDSDRIVRLADVEQWYYDRPGTVDPSLKKKMGKQAKHYKDLVSAAAYRIAAKTGSKVEMSSTRDGKVFTVNTQGGGKYDLDISDLKDKQGRYYDAEDAAVLPEVKTQYEKWMSKACPSDYDVTNVKNLLKKNSTNPATVDVDWLTSEQDLGVYPDGTRELSVNFQNKNSFGVDMRYIATIKVSPKCTYKVEKLDKY